MHCSGEITTLFTLNAVQTFSTKSETFKSLGDGFIFLDIYEFK